MNDPNYATDVVLANNVLWGNAATYGHEIGLRVWVTHGPATFAASYCNVEGGLAEVSADPCFVLYWDPNTNIDADPLFVDADGPDDDPNTWEDNDYHLSPNSPCIDTGDPNRDYTGQTDIDGQARANGVVDMGSDEVWPDGLCTLTLSQVNDSKGDVNLDPEPNDPNLPQYAAGTVLMLTAVPIGGGTFKQWKIYDPNHPGDSNYMATDTNWSTTIVMDDDREVKAVFKCASDVGPMLPMMLAVLGLFVWIRQRA
jgi:hypothetical protein